MRNQLDRAGARELFRRGALLAALLIGIGLGLYLYFDTLPPETESLSPEKRQAEDGALHAKASARGRSAANPSSAASPLDPEDAARAKRDGANRPFRLENLEVTVIDRRSGQPVENAAVLVLREVGGGVEEVAEEETGENGTAFMSLPEGQYFIVVDHEGYALFQIEDVHLSSQSSSFRVPLLAGAPVSGQVWDPGRQPIPQATVSFIGPSPARITTDSGGRFRVRLLPGVYDILAQSPRHGQGEAIAVEASEEKLARVEIVVRD